jgi:peptide/nickel transport system permease protein
VVRGKFMSLRGEEFVLASRSFGASALHIIWKHLIPNFMSYIIVNLSLSIPNMILTETSLSFLGLGLQAPAVSWGVLLKNAQNFQDIVLHPWILSPGAFVVVAILALNFLGDGIRDAADPFSHRSG